MTKILFLVFFLFEKIIHLKTLNPEEKYISRVKLFYIFPLMLFFLL